MGKSKPRPREVLPLIAALLLTILLSGVAVRTALHGHQRSADGW